MTLVEQPLTETRTSTKTLEPAPPRPLRTPRHVKVTGHAPALGYEPCEDVGCVVGKDGVATSCGRSACPNCGYGGTNVKLMMLLGGTELHARCTSCGHMWAPGQKPVYVLSRAETVECTCPDACERDHSNE